MLDRTISAPPTYAERSCLLVSYRLPFLPHCHMLCHAPEGVGTAPPYAELAAFFFTEAKRLAEAAAGDPEAFMMVYSGATVRKRANLHVHVFIVQSRHQKAWLYAVLALKNTTLVIYNAANKLAGRRKRSPARAVDETPQPRSHTSHPDLS